MRKWLLAFGAAVIPLVVWAQSAPNWPTGYRPSSAELNAAFAGKQDIGLGFANAILTNPTITGGTITRTLIDLSVPGPIGGVTPNTAIFTTLTSAGVVLTGGTITGTPISGSTGSFTTLTSSGAAITGGTIAGTPISGSTGAFTTLTASAATSLATLTATRINSNATGAQLQINAGTSVDGPAIDWIFGRMRWFGIVTGPNAASDNQISPNQFIFTDAAEVRGATVSDSAILAMTVVEGNTAPLNNAQRAGINSHLVVNGQIGATPVGGVSVDPQQFVSSLSSARSVASQGGLGGWTPGTDPSLGQFRGSLFAGNDLVSLQSGALNYTLVVGREIDISIGGTATSFSRIGLLIASFPSASQAIQDDVGIALITNDNTANNFKNGVQFGGYGSYFNVTDSLIKAVARVVPVGLAGPITVPRGIDFSAAVFTDAFLRGPSNTFVVDGSGNVTGASYKVGATAGANCPAGVTAGTVVVTGGLVVHC